MTGARSPLPLPSARTPRARPRFLFGYGESDITPARGVDLCGYGFYLDRKAVRVDDRLKARAAWLSGGGTDLVLISCDLIGLDVDFSDATRAEIGRRFSLPPSAILLACTHTHSGPATRAMPGLGDADAPYMRALAAKIIRAAERARENLGPAAASYAFETIEPIGYDRRRGDFSGIDPFLKSVILDRSGQKTHLWSYACHAVVRGPQRTISADWPGAVSRALEQQGRRGLFLQGYCGDVDPVTQLNRWGRGTREDLRFYGNLVARRLVKAERWAARIARPALRAAETRVDLRLSVDDRKGIARRAASFKKEFTRFPGAARFALEWKERALAEREGSCRSPFLEAIPVQALAVGPVRIAALPGEIYGAFGLALRRAFDPLIPAGFANGVIGYIPTRKAFADPQDYGAWCAPMIYATFPFAPGVGETLAAACRRLLARLS